MFSNTSPSKGICKATHFYDRLGTSYQSSVKVGISKEVIRYLPTIFDIFPVYLDVLITVGSALFVHETQSVHYFMYDRISCQATRTQA